MSVQLDPIARLSRDLKVAATTLSPREARYLVDSYYQIQEYRKAAANQVLSLSKSAEPHEVLTWFFDQAKTLEDQIKRALDSWSDSKDLGQWVKGIVGIGPVISAGLLAHIDIEKAPTVGHIWRIAGLDPDRQWLGKKKAKPLVEEVLAGANLDEAVGIIAEQTNVRRETLYRMATTGKEGQTRKLTKDSLIAATSRRPWNASLKTLCWKIGESFVKVSGNPESLYGRLYAERKAYEQKKNASGEYADQAKAKLENCNIGRNTEAYQHYSSGVLPPAHIHSRAKRWAVKLFLSHYHAQAYRLHYGVEPPNPYPIEHLGHVHWVVPEKAA
jgi:hypothetical protein